MSDVVRDVLMHPKTAGIVSSSTIVTGLSEKFQLIPWGDVASAAGAALSIVLIVLHILRDRRETKHMRLEDKLLKKKLKKS